MTSDIDPEFAGKALAEKALARRNRSKRNVVLLFGYLAGFGVAAIWFSLDVNGNGGLPGESFFAGLIGFFAALMYLKVRQKRLFPRAAKCPTCSHGWEIREGEGIPLSDYMEYWYKCPGCGELIGDEVLHRALTIAGGRPRSDNRNL